MIPEVETDAEYRFCTARGHDPLVSPHFTVEIGLRKQLQKEIFGHCIIGRGNIPQANQRYYLYMWDNKPHICENCQLPLRHYSAKFISHIFTKGGFPEMAHDPRNCNILCFDCHNLWEYGSKEERKAMRIYPTNQVIINVLLSDYKNEIKKI